MPSSGSYNGRALLGVDRVAHLGEEVQNTERGRVPVLLLDAHSPEGPTLETS